MNVKVTIEKFCGDSHASRVVEIPCRDAAQAEAIGKIITASAEKEKEIARALNSAGATHV